MTSFWWNLLEVNLTMVLFWLVFRMLRNRLSFGQQRLSLLAIPALSVVNLLDHCRTFHLLDVRADRPDNFSIFNEPTLFCERFFMGRNPRKRFIFVLSLDTDSFGVIC